MKNDFRKFYLDKNPYGGSVLDSVVKGQSVFPGITVESEANMITENVFTHLLKNRIIFFGEEFCPEVCNVVVGQMLYLSQLDPEKDIDIYLHSPGGDVFSLEACLSTMDVLPNDFRTTVIGYACSCANVMLVYGTPGKRRALPYARLLAHQPMTGIKSGTQCTDVQLEAALIQDMKNVISNIYLERCGFDTIEEVYQKIDRDCWMKAADALPGKNFGRLGQIDEIITKI